MSNLCCIMHNKKHNMSDPSAGEVTAYNSSHDKEVGVMSSTSSDRPYDPLAPENEGVASSDVESTDSGEIRSYGPEEVLKNGSQIKDKGPALSKNSTQTSAVESAVAANRRLSKILTNTVDEPDVLEVDYSKCPPWGEEDHFLLHYQRKLSLKLHSMALMILYTLLIGPYERKLCYVSSCV